MKRSARFTFAPRFLRAPSKLSGAAIPQMEATNAPRSQSNEQLIERIRRYNRTAEIIECAHRPLYLQNITTGEQIPLERLRGAYVGAICGIAAPESFEGGLSALGAQVNLAKRYIDHHRYSEAELQSFM